MGTESDLGAGGDVTGRAPGGPGRATLMLLLVTLFWGLSFPWMKDWLNAAGECPGGKALAALTMIGLRMALAFAVVALCLPRQTFRATPREHAAGAAVGAVFFAGFALQVWGLDSTTPALSALFTSLSNLWVPLVAWLVLGQRLTLWTLPGFVLGIAGTFVFTGTDVPGAAAGGSGLRFGDWLTLLASVAFAGQVLMLDRLGRYARPGYLTAGFFAGPAVLGLGLAVIVAAAGPGLAAWWGWVAGMLRDPGVQLTVAKLTLLPTVISFHWMNIYQPQVTANRAALVYLLEPIFAAVFSVYQGHESFTTSLVVGGALILFGNVLADGPNWLPRRATSA